MKGRWSFRGRGYEVRQKRVKKQSSVDGATQKGAAKGEGGGKPVAR